MNEIVDKSIIELCEHHKFKHEVIGKYVKIVSRYDEWFILNEIINKGYKIYLWHPSSGKQFKLHIQQKFDTMEHLFNYIHAHDSKIYDINDNIYTFNI